MNPSKRFPLSGSPKFSVSFEEVGTVIKQLLIALLGGGLTGLSNYLGNLDLSTYQGILISILVTSLITLGNKWIKNTTTYK